MTFLPLTFSESHYAPQPSPGNSNLSGQRSPSRRGRFRAHPRPADVVIQLEYEWSRTTRGKRLPPRRPCKFSLLKRADVGTVLPSQMSMYARMTSHGLSAVLFLVFRRLRPVRGRIITLS